MEFIVYRRQANWILLGVSVFNLLLCLLLYHSLKANINVTDEGIWQIDYFGLLFIAIIYPYLSYCIGLGCAFSDCSYPVAFLTSSFPLAIYGLLNVVHPLLSWYFIPFPHAETIVSGILFGGDAAIILTTLIATIFFILAYCLNPVP